MAGHFRRPINSIKFDCQLLFFVFVFLFCFVFLTVKHPRFANPKKHQFTPQECPTKRAIKSISVYCNQFILTTVHEH